MSDFLNIQLAGKDYKIRKLTLRQARDLRIGALGFADSKSDAVDWAASIVAVALSRDHPEMTVDSILDLEMTEKEIGEACGAVLDFAGFKMKEKPTGEALPSAA